MWCQRETWLHTIVHVIATTGSGETMCLNSSMSIAALRTTVEDTIDHRDGPLNVVRGRLLENGKQAAFYPGKLPNDPAHLLGPARAGAQAWLDDDYSVMNFAPAPLDLKPGDGPPHIRLDKAAQFLIGDRL